MRRKPKGIAMLDWRVIIAIEYCPHHDAPPADSITHSEAITRSPSTIRHARVYAA